MAQTDVTSSIVNPSFESGFSGWSVINMYTQTNDAFTLKSGSIYVERWAPAGYAVGTCSITQTLTGLSNGLYTITVAGQNIQQDSDTDVQSGLYLVGGNGRTSITTAGTFSLDFLVTDGTATVGVVGDGVSGNYVAIDNFTLSFKQSLSTYISSASSSSPVNMTSAISNPSFEDGLSGWSNANMWTQTNDAFGLKDGTTYVERWVAAGSWAGYASMKQLVKNLPNGNYELTAAAHNLNQNNTSAAQTGAYITADDQRTTVTTPNTYSVSFTVIDGQAEIGYLAENATGNYLSLDNFQLYYKGLSLADIRTELSSRISIANTLLSSTSEGDAKTALQEAITQASGYTSSSDASAIATVAAALRSAYNTAKYVPTATAPTVVTDTRYARGSVWAFGRSTVTGDNIIEQGFCWAQHKNPTVADSKTTEYIYSSGNIYWMKNLQPATIYYARAYAINSSNAVGYGDVIKIVTIPRGDIHWSYGYEGDETINNRITNAIQLAYYYWNNCTQLTSFYPNIHYASGTPTADCSYGGYMRIGPSTSYQAAGTVMHESLHGVGVGTHWLWYGSSFMRANLTRGEWKGDRTKEVLRFWDNNTDGYLNGDDQHMWPYGVNGASEDNGTDQLYVCNALLAEALGEDGLPLTGTQQRMPYYAFEQENDTKYYIKNESETYGLTSAYLVETSDGKIEWREMTAAEAQRSGSRAAWYIEFTPSNQYYQFRNATSGRYMYLTASSSTNGVTMNASPYNFQLMKGRVDVTVGSYTTRGYWIVNPEAVLSPQVFAATADGATASAVFNLEDGATEQRWIFLSADDLASFDAALVETDLTRLSRLIAGFKAAAQVAHTDKTTGATTAFNSAISAIEEEMSGDLTQNEVDELINETMNAGGTFLISTTPTSSPYDLTFLIENPEVYSTSGWNGTTPTLSWWVAEYFETTFDFYQTLTNMPAGTYQLKAKAFQRPGANDDVYTNYAAGTDNTNAAIYIESASQTVNNIMSQAQATSLGGDVYTTAAGTYVPNSMEAALYTFNNNLYDNEVTTTTTLDGGNVTIGIRGTESSTSYWTLFGNFRLYYYGCSTESQNPAAYAGYDITNAYAPWLSTTSLTGWTNDGFSLNTGAGAAPYNTNGASITFPFFERWTDWNNSLANSEVYQTIEELPNGTYYIGGSFIATQQGDQSKDVTGVTFYAADQAVTVATGDASPELYSLKVTVSDHTLTYGVRINGTDANWVGFDNFFLKYDGTEDDWYGLASENYPIRVNLNNPRMDGSLEGWLSERADYSADGYWGTNSTAYINFTGQFMEAFVAASGSLTDINAYQMLTLPAGTYKFQASVNALNQNDASTACTGVNLFLDEATTACHTGNAAPEVFSVTTDLDAGTYTLGLDVSNTTANWVAWDNAVLYCYGIQTTDAYHVALRQCKEAASTYESGISGAATSAVAQYEWTDAEYAAKSAAEIATAISVLNNATTIATNGQAATTLIANPSFTESSGTGTPTGWTLYTNISGDASDGSQIWTDSGVFNAWSGTINEISLYQTIGSLPNGTYKLTAQVGTGTDNGAESKVALFANPDWDHVGRSEEANVYNGWGNRSFGDYDCYVEVTDNDVQIGIRSDAHFYQVKNFTLTFVTDAAEAAQETDASYLRQDYYWNGTNAYEFDASIAKYANAKNVVIYPAADKANQLIRAAASDQFANTTNKIVNGVCASLVLTDGYGFQNSTAFTATNASYTRSIANDWATIILPYTVEANADLKLYELVSVSNAGTTDGVMVFTSVSSLDAGTPGVIHVNSPVDYTFSATNARVVAATDDATVTPVTGWSLVGTYIPLQIETSSSAVPAYYYIANNKFYHASESLTVNPFRTYFLAADGASVAERFNILTDDATGISGLEGTGAALNVFGDKGCLHLKANDKVSYTIVTVNGMTVGRGVLSAGEQQTLQVGSGVYIVNGQKVLVK